MRKAKTLTVIPGRNALYAGAAVAALAFLPFWWPGLRWPAYALGGLWLAATVVELARLWRARDGVTVARAQPEVVGRGVAFTVSLRVQSVLPFKARLHLREVLPATAEPSLHLARLELPPAAPGAPAACEHQLRLRLPVRGDHVIGDTWLRLDGPLGLLALQWAEDDAAAVKVYPECVASPEEFASFVGGALADKRQNTRQRGEGAEFLAITPFQPGDDLRHVDWRASARQREILVRRHQIEQHREVVILLDCGRLMGVDIGGGSKLDQAVNSALLLAGVAFARGDKCGLGVFDDQARAFLPPQAKLGQAVLAAQLYNVRSDFRETDFQPIFALLQARQRKRSLLVVLSDLAEADASVRYRAALAALSRRHLVVFAALRTPEFAAMLRRPLGGWPDAVEKSLVWRLEREREETLRSLAHGGVTVLDVPPTELTAPLINAYLALRESNRL